jgi:hypothetical protein
MPADRSRRAELQRLIGDRGTVLAFVSVPDLKYRGCGWYFRARAPRDACECDACDAARTGRAAFIAPGSFLAAALLSDYAAVHPATEEQATGKT